MPDIFSDLPIGAPIERVFGAVSTPAGLDAWWTKTCSGTPNEGAEFALGFGPGYDWRARVTRCRPHTEFEFQFVDADSDWIGTRVRFQLESTNGSTQLRFAHIGWPTANEHWRISCYCWPIYLRLLRRWLEHGEVVPYEARLSV
jgi:uncharacterized protein YndB with AHSA1/START domain